MRRVVRVSAVVAAAVVITSCGAREQPAGQPEPSTPPPGTSAASPTTPSAPPPTPPPGATDRADPADCTAADLALSVRDGDAAAGTVYRDLVFTNKTQRTCVVHGFPGVSYVTGDDGHQVGPAAFRDGVKGAPVTLTPGAAAAVPVGFVNVRNYDEAVCKPTEVRGLRVYPPHDTASMFLPLPGTGCAGTPPGNQLTVRTAVPA